MLPTKMTRCLDNFEYHTPSVDIVLQPKLDCSLSNHNYVVECGFATVISEIVPLKWVDLILNY